MKKSKYSEEQIATALQHIQAGVPIAALTCNLWLSEHTYYLWRKK